MSRLAHCLPRWCLKVILLSFDTCCHLIRMTTQNWLTKPPRRTYKRKSTKRRGNMEVGGIKFRVRDPLGRDVPSRDSNFVQHDNFITYLTPPAYQIQLRKGDIHHNFNEIYLPIVYASSVAYFRNMICCFNDVKGRCYERAHNGNEGWRCSWTNLRYTITLTPLYPNTCPHIYTVNTFLPCARIR